MPLVAMDASLPPKQVCPSSILGKGAKPRRSTGCGHLIVNQDRDGFDPHTRRQEKMQGFTSLSGWCGVYNQAAQWAKCKSSPVRS